MEEVEEQVAAIRRDRDAMGHALCDSLEDPEVYEIIERSDGLIDTGLGRYYFAEFPGWWTVEQEVIQCITGGRVLDLGCGAGRVGLYLQSKGIACTCIDNSPGAIEVCQRRGVKDARVLSITQLTPALGRFDHLVMFGNNWGLMGSFKRARWLLRRFHAITNPSAQIIATSTDVYNTTNPIHLAYQAQNRARGRMSGQLRLRVRYGIHCGPWFDYLIVSKTEMEQILEGTGWRVDHYIDDASGYRYCAVIKKTI